MDKQNEFMIVKDVSSKLRNPFPIIKVKRETEATTFLTHNLAIPQ